MKMVRALMALVAVMAVMACLCVVDADAGGKKKKGKKKRGKAVAGKVVKLEIESGKGSLTIKTRGNKKKMTEGKEYTFKVTADTKVEKVKGKKQVEEAKISDVKLGRFIRVFASKDSADTAAKIQLFGKRKGKKKKKSDS